MTVAANNGGMTTRSADDPPLASYVLRVIGKPATLRYELHDVRTGERRRFSRADKLAAFLRQHGLLPEFPQDRADGEPVA